MDDRVIGIHANMVTMDQISIVDVESEEDEEEEPSSAEPEGIQWQSDPLLS